MRQRTIKNQLKDKKTNIDIQGKATEYVESPKAEVLSSTYLSYLHQEVVVKEFGKTDLSSVKNFIIDSLEQNNIIIYVIKYPGESIEELDYPLDRFLACYSKPIQIS